MKEEDDTTEKERKEEVEEKQTEGEEQTRRELGEWRGDMDRTWEELEENEKQKQILKKMGARKVKLKEEEKVQERE